jgi:lambda repressor-like predicted transcriptional regulator
MDAEREQDRLGRRRPSHVPRYTYAAQADTDYATKRNTANETIVHNLGMILRWKSTNHKDLAGRMGLSYGALRDRLYGKKSFEAGELIALAALLDIEPTMLWDDMLTSREVMALRTCLPVPDGAMTGTHSNCSSSRLRFIPVRSILVHSASDTLTHLDAN